MSQPVSCASGRARTGCSGCGSRSGTGSVFAREKGVSDKGRPVPDDRARDVTASEPNQMWGTSSATVVQFFGSQRGRTGL